MELCWDGEYTFLLLQVRYIYIFTPQIHLNFFTVYRQNRHSLGVRFDKTGWAGPWSGSRHETVLAARHKME